MRVGGDNPVPDTETNIRAWTDTGVFEKCVICRIRGQLQGAASHSTLVRAGWVLCKTHAGMFDAALEAGAVQVRLECDIPKGIKAKIWQVPDSLGTLGDAETVNPDVSVENPVENVENQPENEPFSGGIFDDLLE